MEYHQESIYHNHSIYNHIIITYHSFIIVLVYLANTVNELSVHKANDFMTHLLEILESKLNSLATILLIAVMDSNIGDIENNGELYHKAQIE